MAIVPWNCCRLFFLALTSRQETVGGAGPASSRDVRAAGLPQSSTGWHRWLIMIILLKILLIEIDINLHVVEVWEICCEELLPDWEQHWDDGSSQEPAATTAGKPVRWLLLIVRVIITIIQGGRSWQPFGEGKKSQTNFVRRVFSISRQMRHFCA